MAARKPLRYQRSFFIDTHFQCPPSTNIQQLLPLLQFTTTTTTVRVDRNEDNNHINEENNEDYSSVCVGTFKNVRPIKHNDNHNDSAGRFESRK